MKRVNLPVPVGNGIAAAVEVASFMAALKTVEVVVTNNYVGSVHVEVSADGGVSWGPFADFTTTDQDTQIVCCSHMRVRVSGFKTGTLTAVAVGGEEGITKFVTIPVQTNPPISPGTAVNVEDLEYIKTVIVSGSFHGSINLVVANAVDTAVNLAYFAPWKTYSIPTTEEDIEAVVAYIGAYSKGAQPGDTPKVTIACSVPASDIASLSSLPHNVEIYVNNTILGFDGNPGTAALPVKTLERALQLMPALYTGYCRIIFQANGFYFPPAGISTGFSEPFAVSRIVLGRPVGVGSTPVAFVCDWVSTSLLGAPARTVTILGTSLSFSGTAPGFSGATPGTAIKFTSGALIGQQFVVRKFLFGVYTFFEDVSAAIVGDTFDVLAPAAFITAPDFTTIVWDGEGGNAMSIAGPGMLTGVGFGPSAMVWTNGMRVNVCGSLVYSAGFTTNSFLVTNGEWTINDRTQLLRTDSDLFGPFFQANPAACPIRGFGWITLVPTGFGQSTLFGGFCTFDCPGFGSLNVSFTQCNIAFFRPIEVIRAGTFTFEECRVIMEAVTPYFHQLSNSGFAIAMANSQVSMSHWNFVVVSGSGVIFGACSVEADNFTGSVTGFVLVGTNGAHLTVQTASMLTTSVNFPLTPVALGYPGATIPYPFPVPNTTFVNGASSIDGN